MTIEEWNERYSDRERAAENRPAAPAALVKHWADQSHPGSALDLACGTGRNALYLAGRGWQVSAVDGAPAAIEYLRESAAEQGLEIQADVADLTGPEFRIQPGSWDLISVCYYLQRNLFPAIRLGVRPGGVALAIVHIVERGEGPTETRAVPGELRSYFEGWNMLHYREGKSQDPEHRRAVAEILAVNSECREPVWAQRSLVRL